MDNNKLPIETVTKLIKLRNLLDAVSQVSWSFSILNKQYPISSLTQDDADKLIVAYDNLRIDVEKLVGNG